MAKKDSSMEVQKQEAAPTEEMERTRSRRRFVPRSDIYETDGEIVLVADVPGASDKTVDITLEKNILSVNAFIEPVVSSGYTLAYAEYDEGDYERSFQLSDEIDRDKIEATVSNGVLVLRLPKAPAAQTRKISVKEK
jgi:HSP20 family protein